MHGNYKRTYTKEEAEDLVKWIETAKPTGEIDLGQGVMIRDLEVFASQVKHIALEKYDNPTFSGQISLMMDVRERLGSSAQ
jgi:hypothetical protein